MKIDIVEDLKNVTENLDKLDNYFNSMSELESNVDMKLSDLYHCIENNQLKTNECYRIVKEIKKQRQIRRNLKNDYELMSVYKNNHARLNNENNRKLFMAELYKRKKELNKKYKNRVYSELDNILRGKNDRKNTENHA